VQTAFLVLAGILGGIIGTAGGITSLATYPALLAVGLGPLQANITNTVALISGAVVSSAASGPELREHRRSLPLWASIAVAGGAVGAVLLLVTPPGVFAWIVPFLIAFASLLVLVQPTAVQAVVVGGSHRIVAGGAFFAVCVYSGYFGAGAGVLTLAIVLLLVDPHLARANAVKNLLCACASILPAVIFTFVADVAWWAAIPLAVGAGIGGAAGPTVTRRLPPRILRAAVAVMGLVLATWLTLDAAGVTSR
jgi:uncharacterized membrane protein YfcA